MKYTFDGNWSFQMQLDQFNQLEFEKTSSNIEIVIRDFLDDAIEPFQEQVNTINFLIVNEGKIVDILLDKIWSNWSEIYEDYAIDDYKGFPKISSKADLKKIIGIKAIYIHPLHRDGFAYYGLLGNCMWDEEHGLGFVNHKNRIIEYGGAEEADAGGSESRDAPDNSRPKEPATPKLYKAHPVFGTFKPAHQQANIDYPHKLIEKNLNAAFKNYLSENPDVDFIHPDDSQKRTYLKTACMCNNEEVFNLLINEVQNFDKAIYSAHKRKNLDFLERLIEKGADIHEAHFGTSILTEAVEQHLRTISINLTEEQMTANHQRMMDYYNLPDVNKFSPLVKEMTMHPREWIERSRNYIEKLIDYGIAFDERKINYIKDRYRNQPAILQAIDEEVKYLLK